MGNYRPRNEDRCVVDSDYGVFLVVDGVGGRAGGREASETIARVLPAWLRRTLRCGWCDIDLLQDAIEGAVEAARQEMLRMAETDADLGQMGATFAFAAILNRTLFITHAGDCRGYLLHRGKLRRLTADQTFVQAAIDAGVLSAAEAKGHPWRHVVTNAVGIKAMDEPLQVKAFPLSAGDRVLLCTDGLTDAIADRELRELLMSFDDVHDVADALIHAALQADARDNVTCVVIDLVDFQTNDNVCLAEPALAVS
jgi:protein phosphatase